MTSTVVPHATPHATWMERGIALHAQGQLEQALSAFENARALAPSDPNTSVASATLLVALSRPQAAYRLLLTLEKELMASAEGATNLGIAAEACGDLTKAEAAYRQALTLDPTHVRALTNAALLAGAQSRWVEAVAAAEQAVALAPDEPGYRHNLSDLLAAAGHYRESLDVLELACLRFPDHLDISMRRIAALAFCGRLEDSAALEAKLTDGEREYFLAFLKRAAASADPDKRLLPAPDISTDAFQLYTDQAFSALITCDWRESAQLAATLRRMLADCMENHTPRDFREAQFFGTVLGLREDELAQMREVSTRAIAARQQTALPTFSATRKPYRGKDQRIQIGLAVPGLADSRTVSALQRQLQLHDRNRFAFHVYSSTRRPNLQHKDTLAPLAASLVETAHMTHAEAAARMRLDQLDVFVDMAFNSPWCRPEVLALRVAPVQIRQLTWHRHHPAQPCDYNLSDTFIHPDGLDLNPFGPVVRLPHTCWLDTRLEGHESRAVSRVAAGLPDDAFVLCSVISPATLDPSTFSLWMDILRALPHAVLWLPGFGAAASHLCREAEAVGMSPHRIRCSASADNLEMSADLRLADLFLDPIRFNANQGLVDALRLGVPAITCAGKSMASRLGGSIIRAAGLPDCVCENEATYLEAAIRLGQDSGHLKSLRTRLQAAIPTAPLFNLPARVRELEAAWTIMIERSRAGLPPAAFDVPPD
ncbi:tetratricopeptide repeat protein [Polaromonas sp. A23]|uniref:O-linked N-acetylglucosamine transferase family protein n=1 Tax=Polaromonas sp. A23 TaxID=1944133 RepID=UPI000984730A|nr:tetratricopeptide repeat protein [Polaromonas sp. A23]